MVRRYRAYSAILPFVLALVVTFVSVRFRTCLPSLYVRFCSGSLAFCTGCCLVTSLGVGVTCFFTDSSSEVIVIRPSLAKANFDCSTASFSRVAADFSMVRVLGGSLFFSVGFGADVPDPDASACFGCSVGVGVGRGAGCNFCCLRCAAALRCWGEQYSVQCPSSLQWWHTLRVEPFHVMITVDPKISKRGRTIKRLPSGT